MLFVSGWDKISLNPLAVNKKLLSKDFFFARPQLQSRCVGNDDKALRKELRTAEVFGYASALATLPDALRPSDSAFENWRTL